VPEGALGDGGGATVGLREVRGLQAGFEGVEGEDEEGCEGAGEGGGLCNG
jgi:hypothetical protein